MPRDFTENTEKICGGVGVCNNFLLPNNYLANAFISTPACDNQQWSTQPE